MFEGSQYGGALMNTTEVENFPGFPDGHHGPGADEPHPRPGRALRRRAGQPTTSSSVDLTGPVKIVRTHDGEYTADAVILAMGSAYRKLGVAREDELSGHGVSWCATCDGFFFRDQDIAVVGGGDTAMEEATFLTRFASSVTVVHRRDALRASRIMVERAEANPKIRWAWNSEVVEHPRRRHGRPALRAARHRRPAPSATLEVGGLFIAIGHEPRSELVARPGRARRRGLRPHRRPARRTNLDGVFAAGDLVDHTYRQAITAAGTGCQAALDAERYLAALADARPRRDGRR